MQERHGFPRALAARRRRFTRPAFGGFLSHAKRAAAISIAAFFVGAVQLPSITANAAHAGAGPVAERPAGPALWAITDADTIIYLFGTFHALDARSGWFSDSVKAAFDASDELVLETLVPEDPAELHAMLVRQALASAPKPGAPVVGGGGTRSFAASAGQAMSAGRSMGMTVDQGADAVLRRAAASSGKPVDGLESFEFQLAMFGSLPAPSAVAPAPQVTGSLTGLLSHMQSAWRRGDSASFASILANVEAQSPAAYQRLFVERNAHWAGWIAGRLERPGIVFVAVGTGHLIGRDSVQRMLADRGIASFRIS